MTRLPVVTAYAFNYLNWLSLGSSVSLSPLTASELMRRYSLPFEEQRQLFKNIRDLP